MATRELHFEESALVIEIEELTESTAEKFSDLWEWLDNSVAPALNTQQESLTSC